MDPETVFGKPVSIHAPVKDATLGSTQRAQRRLCFNPRAREGRDERCVRTALDMAFQSTRP